MAATRKWDGETVCVLCSGPSLTAGDVDQLRHLRTIAVNTSWEMAPWCDAVFAYDYKWWEANASRLKSYKGERISVTAPAMHFGARVEDGINLSTYRNSGAAAVALAIHRGAKAVLLLGADCRVDLGRHWHPDHGPGLTNCGTVKTWPLEFAKAAALAAQRAVPVYNCSPVSALTCFTKLPLTTALEAA
jgi:hypothetical protein